MELNDIKKLIAAVNESAITKLSIEREGFKLVIEKCDPALLAQLVGMRHGQAIPQTYVAAAPVPFPAGFGAAPGGVDERVSADAARTAGPERPSPAGEGGGLAPGQWLITAPMVGTFYRAPAPEAPPFVEVGQVVEKGQTVCIIEAMKLMNEIECEKRGRVVRVLVENAQPVEYGQPLFVMEQV